MTKLRISDDLLLPLDAVTQKLAFLGRTGSGKSYAATKLAELMLEAGAQIVALDPVGIWHGLRMGPNALSIPVLGGLRGDVPLEPTGGALVADLIVDRGISAVLDVSQMIPAEQTRFATDFATRFFQRKKASPSAVHVFLEECQEVVPQNPMKGEERMLHAFQRLQKLGRNFGIGVSLISQRPQEVSKKALNQAECLFAFQMTGPQERKTMAGWVAEKGLDTDVQALLPKLAVGHAHVWSPQWLDVSKTIAIAQKQTADVSATPKVGAKSGKARELSPIDLEQLGREMAASIERAKHDDPKELRKRIAELERQNADLQKQLKARTEPRQKRVDVPIVRDKDVAAIDAALNKARALAKALDDCVLKAVQARHAPLTERPAALPSPGLVATRPRQSVQRATGGSGASANGSLAAGQRKILSVLAQYPAGRTRTQIAILAGYAHNGGGFRNYLGALRSAGYVDGHDPQRITDAGIRALGAFEPLPTGRALLDHWLGALGKAERSALHVLADAYPKALTSEDVARRAGYEAAGGGFRNALGKLRTLELINGRGELRASDTLFEGA